MELRSACLLFNRCFASAAGKDEFDSNRSGAIPGRGGRSNFWKEIPIFEQVAFSEAAA